MSERGILELESELVPIIYYRRSKCVVGIESSPYFSWKPQKLAIRVYEGDRTAHAILPLYTPIKQYLRIARYHLRCPAPKIGISPALKDAIIPSNHRPSESSCSKFALIHSHRPSVGDNPHLLGNPRRENRTVHDSKHQYEPEDCQAAEHGAPRPSHLDPTPARPAVHSRQDSNVDEFQPDRETCPRDRGFQPAHLLMSGD